MKSFFHLQQLKQLVTNTQNVWHLGMPPLYSALLSPLPLPSFSLSFSHIKMFWSYLFRIRNVLEAICEDVRMCGAPDQRPELHDRDEPAQVVHLGLLVLCVHHAREVEQLGPLVHLRPKSVLEILFGSWQGFVVLEGVEVGEHSHDSWESMHLGFEKINSLIDEGGI